MKIAVVQQNHGPGMLISNRKKALRSAETAIRSGADLILFHEEMTIGYTEKMKQLAEPADGETSQMFCRLLNQLHSDACIVYGLSERLNDLFYISAPVITKKGVRTVYRKTHLFHHDTGLRDESLLFTAGNEFVTFNHCDTQIGIMICYDGDFPETASYYRNQGCALILWLNNRESRGPDDWVKTYAIRNSLALAVSCCCGINERGQTCRGGSNITDADGTVLSELWDQEGILYAEIDPSKIYNLRKKNYWITDRREDLY